jgi:hypothetical protein
MPKPQRRIKSSEVSNKAARWKRRAAFFQKVGQASRLPGECAARASGIGFADAAGETPALLYGSRRNRGGYSFI